MSEDRSVFVCQPPACGRDDVGVISLVVVLSNSVAFVIYMVIPLLAEEECGARV